MARGATRGGQGGTITQAPNHDGGRITAGVQNYCERPQQCHKYFLQYSKFASERAQERPCGRQTCFLPRTPSNLVTPLTMAHPGHHLESSQNSNLISE